MIHKSNPRTHFFAVVAACIFGFFAMPTNVFADSDCSTQEDVLNAWKAYAGSTDDDCNPNNLGTLSWCRENYSNVPECKQIAMECAVQGVCAGSSECADSCSSFSDCPSGMGYTQCSGGCCTGGGGGSNPGGGSGGGGVEPMDCTIEDVVIELVSTTEVGKFSYWNPSTPLFGYPYNRCGLAQCTYCGTNTNVSGTGNGWINIISVDLPPVADSGVNCASIGTSYHFFERCAENNSNGCGYTWNISSNTLSSCNTCMAGYDMHAITDVMLMTENVDYAELPSSSGLKRLLELFRSSRHALLSEDDVNVCIQCVTPSWSNVSGQNYQEWKGNKCYGEENTKKYRCQAGYKGDRTEVRGSTTGLNCTACPSGTYQPEPGKTTCLPCPNFGTTSALTSPTGATDITSCFVNCAPSPLYSDTKGTFRLTTGCSNNRCYYSE